MINIIKILMEHGFSGYLILFTGVICIFLSLERIYFLYIKWAGNFKGELDLVAKEISNRNYKNALQISNTKPTSFQLSIVKSGIMAMESGREGMNSAINAEVLDVAKKVENRLPYLSLIASSATLLGLFGTIMGLISTFAAIANADPSTKSKLLGLGISQAMYSTAAGVIVGIVAMVVHTICISKADELTGEAQNIALNLVKWIEHSERKNG